MITDPHSEPFRRRPLSSGHCSGHHLRGWDGSENSNTTSWDLPSDPVVKNLPWNAEGVGWGTKTPTCHNEDPMQPDIYIFFKSDFPAILGAEIQQEYHKGSALKDSVGGRNSKQEEKKQWEWGGWLWADSGRRERRL